MSAKKKEQILIMGPRYRLGHVDQPATNKTVVPLYPPGVEIEKSSKKTSNPNILYPPGVGKEKEEKK